MSSRSTALKLKKPVSLFIFLFRTFWSNKLNFHALETPFQEEIWSPPSELAFMTVNILKLFTKSLVYTSSAIHKIRKFKTITLRIKKIHDFQKMCLAFSIEY